MAITLGSGDGRHHRFAPLPGKADLRSGTNGFKSITLHVGNPAHAFKTGAVARENPFHFFNFKIVEDGCGGGIGVKQDVLLTGLI